MPAADKILCNLFKINAKAKVFIFQLVLKSYLHQESTVTACVKWLPLKLWDNNPFTAVMDAISFWIHLLV